MIKYDYRQEKLRSGEIIYRPVAKVYLLSLDFGWIPQYFYVDSGADYTLVPYRMGKFLGMQKRAGDVQEIGGVGGGIKIRLTAIQMKVGEHEFASPIAWAQIENVPFLLGREGVFDHFEITFNQKNHMVCFRWLEGK